MSLESETIAAVATYQAPSGVSIIRVSGNLTKSIVDKVFKSKTSPLKKERELVFGSFIDDDENEIDTGLCVYFKGPKSYTGEDCLEFHYHGNPLISKLILRELYKLGVKPAEAGEFTKRAFLNGKLDLIQAEAVADMIEATSETSLKLAKEHLEGKLSESVAKIGEPLKNVLAEIEAHIDFPEEDISPDTLDSIKQKLVSIKKEINNLLGNYDYGVIIKDGFRVLLTGVPNVGKSSLLNAILGESKAIVTDISGTTRDAIEIEANINGYKVILCDSAGLTDKTDDVVEKIGIEKTVEKFDWANLVLFISSIDTKSTNQNYKKKILETLKEKKKEVILINNKSDLNKDVKIDINVSSSNKKDIESLKKLIVDKINIYGSSDEPSHIITQERHRVALTDANKYLQQTIESIDNKNELELTSADLRSALNSLNELVGVTHIEDILGRIFSKFCIGK